MTVSRFKELCARELPESLDGLLEWLKQIADEGSQLIGKLKNGFSGDNDGSIATCNEICASASDALEKIASSPLLSANLQSDARRQITNLFHTEGHAVDFAIIANGPLMARTEQELLETNPSLGDPLPPA